MSKRIALIDINGNVDNVAEFQDDWTGTEWDGYVAIVPPIELGVGPGWSYIDGVFIPPPVRWLNSDRYSIPADGTTVATLTYKDTYDNAPVNVIFVVNGASSSNIPLDTNGEAKLEITAANPGRLEISVQTPDGVLTFEAVAE